MLEGLMQVGILIPFMCLLRRENVQNGFKLTLLFCGFFLMNKFLLVLPLNVKTFSLFEGDWNWSEKLYAIIGSVLFYGLFKNYFSQHDFLVLKQAKGSLRKNFIVTLVITTLSFLAGIYMFSRAEYSFDKLAYQFSMPGIDEEIAYRGVMLGLLLTLLKEKIRISKISFGNPAIWITAILFGLVHTLHLSITPTIKITMNWSFFFQSILIGYLFGWMAIKARSILMPMLAHNAINFFRNLGTMI